MNKRAIAPLSAATILGMFVGQVPAVHAQLDQILKGGAVLVVVDKFGGDIDRFVNTITGNRPDSQLDTTRVVPILSIGRGAYAGAVQISGPREQVEKVKAVAQLEAEGKLPVAGKMRVRGLIPIANRDVKDIAKLTRVKGVGISALVEVKL